MDSSAPPGARPDRGAERGSAEPAGGGRRVPGWDAVGTRGDAERMRWSPGGEYAPGHPCQRVGSCATLRAPSCPSCCETEQCNDNHITVFGSRGC